MNADRVLACLYMCVSLCTIVRSSRRVAVRPVGVELCKTSSHQLHAFWGSASTS